MSKSIVSEKGVVFNIFWDDFENVLFEREGYGNGSMFIALITPEMGDRRGRPTCLRTKSRARVHNPYE